MPERKLVESGTVDDVFIVSSAEGPTFREQALAEARRLARALAGMGATLVVLFGSRARGESRAGSDIDLLAVMASQKGFLDRIAEAQAALRPRVPTDLFIYTPAEFERLRRERWFVKDAVERGVVLHGTRP